MTRVSALACVLASACVLPGTGSAGPAEPSAQGRPRPPRPAGPPTAIACGDFATCALVADGQVRCWGIDKSGELGDGGGPASSESIPVPTSGKAKAIAMAAQFGCALLDTGKVECWGTGRIANDGKVHTAARPIEAAGVHDADALVARGAQVCARTAAGIRCWGADPEVIGTPPAGVFTSIAAGFTHACAIDEKESVTCWGGGDWGRKEGYAEPRLAGAKWVVAGDRHACAVTKKGAVLCWGSNDAGQLGTKPDPKMHRTPLVVAGARGASRLVAGEASTCAIFDSGSLTCWGANDEGELARGARSNDERPKRTPALANVASMCIGGTHACAITKNSKLVCWGKNGYGQLGDATLESHLAPVSVAW